MALQHRFSCDWAKFRRYKDVFLQKRIAIAQNMKLFDAAVSPMGFFGCEKLSLAKSQLQKLDVLQRRTLRSLVGWFRLDGEPWSHAMRRMQHRVPNYFLPDDLLTVDNSFPSCMSSTAQAGNRRTIGSLICRRCDS